MVNTLSLDDPSESGIGTGTTGAPLEGVTASEVLPSLTAASLPETSAQAVNIMRAEYHATVHDIPLDDRPRERLQKYGADSLALAELLAIILRTGTTGENVIELSGKLLAKYSGLAGLMSADFHELSAEHGLGLAKTAQLKAALELGKRLSMLQPEKRYQIKSSADAANIVKMEMMFLDHEEMHILLLDTRNQLVECIKRYKGTVNSSVLRSAEIFRSAIVRNCPSVIICHNHPSGDPTPSPKGRPQLTHYFIGISSEKGFFINPELLVIARNMV